MRAGSGLLIETDYAVGIHFTLLLMIFFYNSLRAGQRTTFGTAVPRVEGRADRGVLTRGGRGTPGWGSSGGRTRARQSF